MIFTYTNFHTSLLIFIIINLRFGLVRLLIFLTSLLQSPDATQYWKRIHKRCLSQNNVAYVNCQLIIILWLPVSCCMPSFGVHIPPFASRKLQHRELCPFCLATRKEELDQHTNHTAKKVQSSLRSKFYLCTHRLPLISSSFPNLFHPEALY